MVRLSLALLSSGSRAARSAYKKAETGVSNLPELIRLTLFLGIVLGVAAYVSLLLVEIRTDLVEIRTDRGWDWWERWLVFGSIGTVGVLVVAGYAAFLQLRETRKAAHADLVLRLNETWASDRFVKSRSEMFEVTQQGRSLQDKQDLLRKAIKEAAEANEEQYFILTRIGDFFDLVAHFVEWGYLTQYETYEEFGPPMANYYDHFKKYVEQETNDPGQQDLWNAWGRLAEEYSDRAGLARNNTVKDGEEK